MGSAFPEEAGSIEERASALADSLTSLDQEIRETLRPLENRAFIATHTAWTYLAKRYDLVEAGSIHAHPGHEPSSRELVHLMELAQARAAKKGISMEEELTATKQRIPSGRMAKPEEIAAAVAFLSSDLAGHISGQSLLIDGGETRAL